MRLNPNLRSRIDQDAALQDLRERDYMQERLARLNRMDTDYSRFYTPRSRWSIFREFLAFGWFLAKWTVVIGVAVLIIYGLVEIALRRI